MHYKYTKHTSICVYMRERQIKIITYISGQCEYSANTKIFSMILLNHILVILFLLDFLPNMCMIIFVCILSNEIFLLNYMYSIHIWMPMFD